MARPGGLKIGAVVLTAIAAMLVVVGPTTGASRTHVVVAGETLYRIARYFGVTIDAVAQANGLVDPTKIFVGQVLVIPDPVMSRGEPGTRVPAFRLPPQRGEETRTVQPGAASVHTVQRGDTLYAIARRYRVSVQAMMGVNGLASAAIRVGQQIIIPAAAVLAARPAPPPSAVFPATSNPPPPVTGQPPAPSARLTHLVGEEIPAPRPLRVRRGPRTFHTTMVIVAIDTPLRILREEAGWYEVELPSGETGWVAGGELTGTPPPALPGPESVRGVEIVREAMGYVGTPYQWGGGSARGLDCSGFVYVVFASRVPKLARLSSFDYFHLGLAIERSALQPGDLVFFTTYAPGASHVGIYIGTGRFVHASSGVGKVIVTPLDDSYYAARYLGARRLLPP